jgi:hypothetical protein
VILQHRHGDMADWHPSRLSFKLFSLLLRLAGLMRVYTYVFITFLDDLLSVPPILLSMFLHVLDSDLPPSFLECIF